MVQRERASHVRHRRGAAPGICQTVAGEIDRRGERRNAGILVDVARDRPHRQIAGLGVGKPGVERQTVARFKIHPAGKLGVEVDRRNLRANDGPRAGRSGAAGHEGAERRGWIERTLAHRVLPSGEENGVADLRGIKIHREICALEPRRLIDEAHDRRIGHLGL